jgi:hypothetical protein
MISIGKCREVRSGGHPEDLLTNEQAKRGRMTET